MDMINNKTVDAVRTIGQLLLHRPATNFFAYNDRGNRCSSLDPRASCFCYFGALSVVTDRLKADSTEVVDVCHSLTGIVRGSQWDDVGLAERNRIARKLAEYQG